MSGTDVQPPAQAVEAAVRIALTEDLTPLGDLTSALLTPGTHATAEFVPRRDGVLAGRACADETFRQVDSHVRLDWSVVDGDAVAAGQVIGRVHGELASLLTAERTALNFLSHLSGIATVTRQFVNAAGGHARVWDTRKTTPGLRALEKAAVRAGGGSNHRGNLSDWVMLKDNHLAALGIGDGVKRARERWPGRTVHVECTTVDEVREAVAAGANAILLDNMTPEGAREAVQVVRDSGASCLVEASGGITLETVAAYATTGVDLVSVGGLTNSAPVLDIGLDIRAS